MFDYHSLDNADELASTRSTTHAHAHPPSRTERRYLGLADARLLPWCGLSGVLPSRWLARAGQSGPRTARQRNLPNLPGPHPVPVTRPEGQRALRNLGRYVGDRAGDARATQPPPHDCVMRAPPRRATAEGRPRAGPARPPDWTYPDTHQFSDSRRHSYPNPLCAIACGYCYDR